MSPRREARRAPMPVVDAEASGDEGDSGEIGEQKAVWHPRRNEAGDDRSVVLEAVDEERKREKVAAEFGEGADEGIPGSGCGSGRRKSSEDESSAGERDRLEGASAVTAVVDDGSEMLEVKKHDAE